MHRATRLGIVLALNLLLVASLLTVGLSAHSLGVLAEGADYLADAAAIGVSLMALWLSRRPPTERRPQGYPRASAFAALVNAGWLLVLTLLVAAGSIERLARGARHVQGMPVLIVSGIASAVMLLGALILSGDVDQFGDDDHDALNMRAVLLDTAADAAAAAGVAATGAVILITDGLYWLDPLVALLVSVVVGYHAARLSRRTAAALR